MKQPTLIICKQKVENNIQHLLDKVKKSNVIFRPHFKTHQSTEIGEIFRDKGVDKITVSSVSMAEYFANHGWDDITIAFPVNLREVEKIIALAGGINLNLLIDSAYSTDHLAKLLTQRVGIFIEIDNGYNRSGLLPEQKEEIESIVNIFEKSVNLEFRGFLTHAGNTYAAKSNDEVISIMDDAALKLNLLKSKYVDRFPQIITSNGDTPSCSIADDLSAFDEIRPGNFVYYDVMQYQIGSCNLDDIAVAVACPVVSVYPHRNEIIIYGGAVHLSKESIIDKEGNNIFGLIVDLTNKGWSDPIPGAYVKSISQEHGIVKIPEEKTQKFKLGDVIGVLPVHSCLTADLLKQNALLI